MATVILPERTTEPLVLEAQKFRRKLTQLLPRYEGQFVALYQGRVIGHDLDDELLAQKMYEKFGDAPFYIARVERLPTVYDLPSPEVVW